jgi:hypothetical protein
MLKFVQRFASHVCGVLSGFDRLRFRGTKRLLACVRGLASYLWTQQILFKDFATFAQDSTARLRRAIEDNAHALGRPVVYVPSTNTAKEDLARDIAQRDGIGSGLIAVLTCVEPCLSFAARGNRTTKLLDLRLERMKCLHYYCYFLDAEVGLVHARLQSWLPFTVQICLNGREWLAQQLDRAGVAYRRHANALVAVADVAAAQQLLEQQLTVCWPALLERLLQASHPGHEHLLPGRPVPYYWSVDESEWASDVLFASPAALAERMPQFVRHGMQALHSEDVLRFLGRKLPATGQLPTNFTGEVVSSLKRRPEGVRVGQRLNRNWIKMYDKQGSVLRVETVINDAGDFKVYRAKEGEEDGPKAWRQLRKGVADLHRRAEVSQKANERYLDWLAGVAEPRPLGEVAARLCQPVRWQGRRVRALNPLAAEDVSLLQAVSRGEFLINGFRNRDLRELLYGEAASEAERRRQSGAVTRKLRLLRGHAVIQKVAKTHRYLLTEQGRTALTALEAARQADTAKLLQAA